MIGFKLTRPDCGGWMFAGTTPDEVAQCVKFELEGQDDIDVRYFGGIHIEAFEVTQEQIENMPEFPGW